MSKGSPIIKCRVKPLIWNALMEEIRRRKIDPNGMLTSVSEFLEYAVVELINKPNRRRRSYLKAKERKRLAKEAALESKRIFDGMQAELSKYQ